MRQCDGYWLTVHFWKYNHLWTTRLLGKFVRHVHRNRLKGHRLPMTCDYLYRFVIGPDSTFLLYPSWWSCDTESSLWGLLTLWNMMVLYCIGLLNNVSVLSAVNTLWYSGCLLSNVSLWTNAQSRWATSTRFPLLIARYGRKEFYICAHTFAFQLCTKWTSQAWFIRHMCPGHWVCLCNLRAHTHTHCFLLRCGARGAVFLALLSVMSSVLS